VGETSANNKNSPEDLLSLLFLAVLGLPKLDNTKLQPAVLFHIVWLPVQKGTEIVLPGRSRDLQLGAGTLLHQKAKNRPESIYDKASSKTMLLKCFPDFKVFKQSLTHENKNTIFSVSMCMSTYVL